MAAKKQATSKYKPRFDNRHVRLKTGESQLENGSYVFRWTDKIGKRRAAYAPTLEMLQHLNTLYVHFTHFSRNFSLLGAKETTVLGSRADGGTEEKRTTCN